LSWLDRLFTQKLGSLITVTAVPNDCGMPNTGWIQQVYTLPARLCAQQVGDGWPEFVVPVRGAT